jgi:hypothetical protein
VGGGGGAAGLQPPKSTFKNTDYFLDTMLRKVLRDLRFSHNELLKSVDDKYIRILKNKIKTYDVSH